MAQLERNSESFKNTKSPNTPAFEQLLQGDERCWSPNTSPTQKCCDPEEAYPNHQNKKSVLTKVKERAKKLRHSLSGSRRKHDNRIQGENSTPTGGVTLEEDEDEDEDEDEEEEDEDPEYLGAPMYESELAPEDYKETARQHPRADPLFSEKNVLPQTIKHGNENENEKERSNSSKLAPVSTQSIDSRFSGLSVTSTREQPIAQETEGRRDEKPQSVSSPTNWDKGVSVKEYFMNKLEPGEDEIELSKVIYEAISPRRAPGERGVVEKVKDVVTSFLRPQVPSSSSTTTNTLSRVGSSTAKTSSSPQASISNNGNLSPLIPISTNAHEVLEEQFEGRVLQTN